MRTFIRQQLPFLLVLLIALVLRLPLLNGSFWLDEAAQALESARPFAQQHLIAIDFQPPLMHYLVHFMLFVSKAEWWLRLVSLAAGILTIAGVYMIVKDRWNTKVAIFAGLLLATSAFHIFYSQELRPYALSTCFAVWSWFFWLRYEKRPKPSLAIGFLLTSIAGIYSMYIYPFLLLSQLLYVAIEQRQRFGAFFRFALVIALAFLPWLPWFIGQLKVGTSLTSDLPGWSSAVATPQLKAIPLTLAKFFTGQIPIAGNIGLILMLCIPIAIAAYAFYRLYRQREYRFALYWFVVPLITSWLVSFVVPVIAPKRLLLILPVMFVAIASLLSHSKGKLQRWHEAMIALILIVNIAFFVYYLATPLNQREDWRGVIQVMDQRFDPKTTVVIHGFPDPFAPWRWYGSPLPVTTTGVLRVEEPRNLDQAFSSVEGKNTVLVFDYLLDLTDPHRSIDAWLTTHGYKETAQINGGNIGFIRQYTLSVEKTK